MAEGIRIDGIYIEEVQLKYTSKGEYIYVKYVENGKKRSVKDSDRAIEDFYKVLANLIPVGAKILGLKEYSSRINILGAKFKWKDGELINVTLLGEYALGVQYIIRQGFFTIPYTSSNNYVGGIGFSQEDIKLLEELQAQAIIYVQGVREQITLDQIEEGKENEN